MLKDHARAFSGKWPPKVWFGEPTILAANKRSRNIESSTYSCDLLEEAGVTSKPEGVNHIGDLNCFVTDFAVIMFVMRLNASKIAREFGLEA